MTTHTAHKPKRILILNDLSLRGGRDIQTGIFEYLDDSGQDWDLRLVPNAEASAVFDAIRRRDAGDVAGIILTEELEPAVMDALTASTVPLAVVGLRHAKLESRTRAIAFVRNDNQRIGRLAAEHLLSLGRFNSYVYVPSTASRDRYWSDERMGGFAQALRQAGIGIAVPPPGADVAAWISGLPKPVGALVAYDMLAADILHVCTDAGLDVPNAISIMGVDNDELICRQCRPALTSILPGHRQMGYAAAREHGRLMKTPNGASRQRITIVPPQEVVPRASTHVLPPATMLVRKMRDFIRENACSGISVTDVVRHVHVSRRLAELRFGEIEGTSIRQALETQKLQSACRLLADRKHSVKATAQQCGFKSANRLTRVFKRRYGQSIRDWLLGKRTCA